jgi:hypothetical protein
LKKEDEIFCIDEKWVDIERYDGLYQVSNHGRVRNKKTGRLKKLLKNYAGYVRVHLSRNSKSKNHFVHRLVAIHFVDNEFKKPEVNHINEKRSDNVFSNLEWVTRTENMKKRTCNTSTKDSVNNGKWIKSKVNGINDDFFI